VSQNMLPCGRTHHDGPPLHIDVVTAFESKMKGHDDINRLEYGKGPLESGAPFCSTNSLNHLKLGRVTINILCTSSSLARYVRDCNHNEAGELSLGRGRSEQSAYLTVFR
jgi:hypothetical protein